ncbi:hypothetical protein VP01_523g8 [Puccinia sorghi]|uniref:Uncharacterized protein n=1 Tax=Puccinia sorghi TaxID=27349 RepID=A0A0L6UKK4_9BASI|nr:hypothetical protein VP01_523g8 [Puccinia sorghi]
MSESRGVIRKERKTNTPNGRKVKFRLLPLIGDLGETHKVGGYTLQLANYLCMWCNFQKENIHQLKLGCTLRTKPDYLPRYPVDHIALCVLHNWVEGVDAPF